MALGDNFGAITPEHSVVSGTGATPLSRRSAALSQSRTPKPAPALPPPTQGLGGLLETGTPQIRNQFNASFSQFLKNQAASPDITLEQYETFVDRLQGANQAPAYAKRLSREFAPEHIKAAIAQREADQRLTAKVKSAEDKLAASGRKGFVDPTTGAVQVETPDQQVAREKQEADALRNEGPKGSKFNLMSDQQRKAVIGTITTLDEAHRTGKTTEALRKLGMTSTKPDEIRVFASNMLRSINQELLTPQAPAAGPERATGGTGTITRPGTAPVTAGQVQAEEGTVVSPLATTEGPGAPEQNTITFDQAEAQGLVYVRFNDGVVRAVTPEQAAQLRK
jgi:hypothetical protein